MAPGLKATPQDLTLNKSDGKDKKKSTARKRLVRSINPFSTDDDASGKKIGRDKKPGDGAEAEGESENEKKDSTAMGSAESGTSGKNGAGSNANAVSGGKFGYDDSLTKSMESGKVEDRGGGAEGGHKPPPPGGGGTPPKGREGKAFPHWWPVCVLVDPRIPNGNQMIKGMVDMMADRCKVNLMVKAVSIQPLQNKDSASYITGLSTQMCNMSQAFPGVQDFSSMVITPSDTAADEMCKSPLPPPQKGWTQKVAGCAAVRPGGMTAKQKEEAKIAGDAEQLPDGTPGIQNSIVDNQGLNPRTLTHELMHTFLGWPNGREGGLGIGRPGEQNHFEDDKSNTISDIGCVQARGMAYDDNNDRFKWDRNQPYYYVKEPPVRQWPLGTKVYPLEPPPAPPPPPPTDRPTQIVRNESPGTAPRAQDPPPGESAPKDNPPGGGHKKGSSGGSSSAIAAASPPSSNPSFRNGTAGKSDPGINKFEGVPPVEAGADPKMNLKSFGYDDSLTKSMDSGTVSAKPSDGKMNLKTIGYDESNSKGMGDGVSGGAGTPGVSAVLGPDGKPIEGGVGGGRSPASILADVKRSSATILDDEFFKKMKQEGKLEGPKARGESLRKSDLLKKALY